VRQAFAGYHGPWPRMSVWQGSADNVVSPKNRTQIVRQWTNVHGLPEAPTARDSVDGHSHAVWKDQAGKVLVETYEILRMSHGVPVKPSEGCGHTGQYALDKGICAARYVTEFFGLVPSSS